MSFDFRNISKDQILLQIYRCLSCKNNYFIYVLFTVLALFTTIHLFFGFCTLLLFVYLLFTKSNEVLIPFFVYATFFSAITKVSVIYDTSLFTVILFLFTLKILFFSKIKVKKIFLVPYILLILLTLLNQLLVGYFDINKNLKFYSSLIYIFFVLTIVNNDIKENINTNLYKNILFAFVLGIIISSLLRLFDGDLFQISNFVVQKCSDFGTKASAYIRFSGLYGDPNYYAVNTIMALCIVLFLYYNDFTDIYFTIVTVIVLFILSGYTRSKSAVLMMVWPFIILSYTYYNKTFLILSNSHKTLLSKKQDLRLFVLIFFVVEIICKSVEIIINNWSVVITRFENNNNLNAITTGRIRIWLNYLNYFKNNFLATIIGSGISTPFVKGNAPHNTYIDIIFNFGIISGSVFIWIVIYFFKKIFEIKFNRTILNIGPLVTLSVMYFFLSGLFDIDFVNNIIVAVIIFNIPCKTHQTSSS